MLPGFFICFEGIDGAGKTERLHQLAEVLKEIGFDVVVTREPGGTPLAEELRGLILNPSTTEQIDVLTDTMLFFAARNQHIKNVIYPAMKEGKIVLCDRFIISTYAYQVAGDGLSPHDFHTLLSLVLPTDPYFSVMSSCLLFDVSDETSKQRCIKRAGGSDRWDDMDSEKRNRINECYRKYADTYGVIRVDAEPEPDIVFRDIVKKIHEELTKYSELPKEKIDKLKNYM